MRRTTVLIAALAASLLGLGAGVQPAQAVTPLTNGGFETGDLSGWTTTGAPNGLATGTATVETSFTCPNGNCFGTTVSPVEGSKFALLTAGDGEVYTTLSQTFAAGAGETIIGQARFLSQAATNTTAFNDQAQVVIKDASNTEVTVFSAQSATNSTPWTQWQHTFSAAGTYTVEARVKNGGDHISPSRLALDAVSLEADTQAPTVSGVTPTGKGIGRGTNVAATFSEAMDAATINRATFKLSKAGSTNNVGAALSYDAASHKAVLDPNKRLAAGTRYKAVVTTGAEDLAGNALDQDATTAGDQQKSWTFVTKR
jgi:hypothetical protein